MSEVVCYPWVFCLSGAFGSKKSGMSFCMELSCPAPGNASFLCNSCMVAQGLRLPSGVKGEFWHGGFSGGGHRIGRGQGGEET